MGRKRRKANIFEMAKAIRSEAKKPQKNYGTGLVGEYLIVASYKSASSKDLKDMRHIINKILEERKIYDRINDKKAKEKVEHQDADTHNIDDTA